MGACPSARAPGRTPEQLGARRSSPATPMGSSMGTHRFVLALVVAAILALTLMSMRLTADDGTVAEDTAARLIGAPVLSADGQWIGVVADVATDDAGVPERIRFTAGSSLGFGERVLELPRDAFSVLRGAVVVDLPAEVVHDLAHPAERSDED